VRSDRQVLAVSRCHPADGDQKKGGKRSESLHHRQLWRWKNEVNWYGP